jgi:hypothetical protein
MDNEQDPMIAREVVSKFLRWADDNGVRVQVFCESPTEVRVALTNLRVVSSIVGSGASRAGSDFAEAVVKLSQYLEDKEVEVLREIYVKATNLRESLT